MGRKSALTPEQWVAVERSHLVDGESISSLARKYGIDEAAIRRRLKSEKSEGGQSRNPLISLAKAKIEADEKVRNIREKIAALPAPRQAIVDDLAQKLRNISGHLCSAAEYGAATAHRLQALANSQVTKVDDAEPLQSMDKLRDVGVLTKLANDSASIALNLLHANKDQVQRLNDAPPERPDLSQLSSDDLVALETAARKIRPVQ